MPASDKESPTPAELLAAHPFVVGMEEEEMRRISECIKEVAGFTADQTIFRSGGVARCLYLIRRGDIALEVPISGTRSRIVTTLTGGDILGWSWMFPPYRWAFDARAMSATEAIVLDGESLRRHTAEDCKLGYQVVWRVAREMADRLQATRLQMLDVYGDR